LDSPAKHRPKGAALGDALFRVYHVFNNFRIMYDADFWEAKIFRLVFYRYDWSGSLYRRIQNSGAKGRFSVGKRILGPK
jgi:hypothetical protein